MMEEIYERLMQSNALDMLCVDWRNARNKQIVVKKIAFSYAYRPRDPDLWHLSPYEFVMSWEPRLAQYPTSFAMAAEGSDACHDLWATCTNTIAYQTHIHVEL